ncbi:MAG: BON domain-containing protein [Chitinophagaceae bacterium]|nr:BON domain-containing protein [Chitinophagaceae bacterium]
MSIERLNKLPGDLKIEDSICEKLTAIHKWDIKGIHIESHQGVVTLSGVVPHKEDIHRVESIAATVPGVVQIENMLELTGSGIPEMLSELGSDIARVMSGNTAPEKKKDETEKKP